MTDTEALAMIREIVATELDSCQGAKATAFSHIAYIVSHTEAK